MDAVCGTVLHGEFGKERNLFMELPQGFKQYYPLDVVLLLLKTLYGLRASSLCIFGLSTLAAYGLIKYARSKADPCLYFK